LEAEADEDGYNDEKAGESNISCSYDMQTKLKLIAEF
jgi:hypothetical protein